MFEINEFVNSWWDATLGLNPWLALIWFVASFIWILTELVQAQEAIIFMVRGIVVATTTMWYYNMIKKSYPNRHDLYMVILSISLLLIISLFVFFIVEASMLGINSYPQLLFFSEVFGALLVMGFLYYVKEI